MFKVISTHNYAHTAKVQTCGNSTHMKKMK